MDKTKWEYRKLGEVCDVVMGQSPDGESVNGYEGVEFHQGKICFGEKYLGISEVYTKAPSKLAEENSLLLCVRAPVGKVNITPRKICIGRGLCAIKPHEHLLLSYLYYVLKKKEDYFDKYSMGSTFKAISSKVVINAEIAIPSFSVQQTIVAELDKLNELMALKRKQLADLDSLAQSLFYEMFGDPVANDRGWEVKKWNELFETKLGKMLDKKKLKRSSCGRRPYEDHVVRESSRVRTYNIGNFAAISL